MQRAGSTTVLLIDREVCNASPSKTSRPGYLRKKYTAVINLLRGTYEIVYKQIDNVRIGGCVFCRSRGCRSGDCFRGPARQFEPGSLGRFRREPRAGSCLD